MTYTFKYKRDKSFFFNKVTVRGHAYEVDSKGNWTGSMVLYLPNGSIQVIPNWNQYHLFLGTDWLLANKSKAEEESNTKIKLTEGLGNGN